MRNGFGVVGVLGALALLPACGNGRGLEGDRVLAVVNGSTITEATFAQEAEALPPYVRPIVETPEGRAQFLESLVTRDLLLQEALRRGIDRRPKVRDRIEMARRSVILETLLREVAEKAPGLSDAALRKHYDANRANFEVGERVAVKHLLLKDRGRADAIAARAKKGEPFDKLKAEMSAEQGENSADLGFIERGRFIKEFEQAAFGAAPGSIVGPVRTAYGYHVLWVGEKRAAGIQPFEEVRERIVSDLRDQTQREAFEGLVAELRKQARVRILAVPPGRERPAERNPLSSGRSGAPLSAPAAPTPAPRAGGR